MLQNSEEFSLVEPIEHYIMQLSEEVFVTMEGCLINIKYECYSNYPLWNPKTLLQHLYTFQMLLKEGHGRNGIWPAGKHRGVLMRLIYQSFDMIMTYGALLDTEIQLQLYVILDSFILKYNCITFWLSLVVYLYDVDRIFTVFVILFSFILHWNYMFRKNSF